MKDLLKRFNKGDQRALARIITLVENRSPEADSILAEIYKSSSAPHIIGVTGAPGSGKSTLVDQLICEFSERGKKVAVVAVDPSSPFSGGAVLGDRIRMQPAIEKTDVFIRSVATRGALGGLSKATVDIIHLFAAAMFDVVLIETVGVGQAEVDIVKTADSCVVVLVPGMGDSVQALKAGVLEIADVFVINKSDKDGASHLHKDIRTLLSLDPAKDEDWDIPICKTIATKGEGVTELVERLQAHKQWLDSSSKGSERKVINMRTMLLSMIAARSAERIVSENRKLFEKLVKECVERKTDPFSAVSELLG